MKHIPNIITMCNLAVGFLAVLMAFENQLLFAGLLILISAILDFLDGFTARLLDAGGEIGKNLDSLADVVSFGMAPAALVYQLLVYIYRQSDALAGFTDAPLGIRLVLLSPVMLLLCAAIRLAIFNVRNNQSEFRGLPAPAAGFFFAGIAIYVLRHPSSSITNTFLQVFPMLASIILISLLMILPFRMFALKFKGPGWKKNRVRYIFLIISGILLISLQEIALPVIVIIYLLASLFQNQIIPVSE